MLFRSEGTMASSNDFEPMDQDVDDTLQVQVTNDIFKSNDDELDFEADDLEVTEFTRASTRDAELRSSKESVKDNSEKVDAASPSEGITISITKSDDVDNAKEDGEISEGQSQSDASDIDGMLNISNRFMAPSSFTLISHESLQLNYANFILISQITMASNTSAGLLA